MALIRTFTQRPDVNVRFRSEVECGWTAGSVAGKPILHLETYGSTSRAIPNKVSQSLELDEDAARELLAILRRTFPRLP